MEMSNFFDSDPRSRCATDLCKCCVQFQTVLIGVLIIIEIAAFVTLPFLGVQGYGQFYLNILLNLVIVANNLITPVVLFAFNEDVQKHLFAMFPSYRQSTSQPFSHTRKVVAQKDRNSF